MNSHPAVAAACLAGAFVFGLVLSLGRILLPQVAKRLSLGERQAGWLLVSLHLALFSLMLLAGVLCDRWPPVRVLILGSLITAVGLGLLVPARTFRSAVLALMLVGLGGAGLSAGSIVLMPRAFWPDHAAASLNLGNVFFALGALVAPAVGDLVFRAAGFQKTLTLLALVCLVPALLGAIAAGSVPADPAAGPHPAIWGAATLWLATLIFFLYGPLEWSVGAWASGYLAELGYRPRRAAFLVAGFWLSFLAARFLMAVLQRPGGWLGQTSDPWVLCGLAVLATVALGNLAGTNLRGPAGFGLLLLGAALGPIFPTLVGIVFDRFPDQEGTAYGAMFAIGSIGGFLIPPAITRVAERRRSVRFALRVPAILGIPLILVVLLLALWV